MHDTSPEMDSKMCEMIRTKSPIERLKMGCSMYETSRKLIIRSIKEDNPGISETDLKKELFLKFYGNDFDAVQRENIIRYIGGN